MRISTDSSEKAYAAFLDLAGGNSDIVMAAFDSDQIPSFEQVLSRIVDLRIEKERGKQ